MAETYAVKLNRYDLDQLGEAQGILELDKRRSDTELRDEYERSIQRIGSIVAEAERAGVKAGRRREIHLTCDRSRQSAIDTAIEALELDSEKGLGEPNDVNRAGNALWRVYPTGCPKT